MQKDIVLPIVVESLQIARDGGEIYILQLTKKTLNTQIQPLQKVENLELITPYKYHISMLLYLLCK